MRELSLLPILCSLILLVLNLRQHLLKSLFVAGALVLYVPLIATAEQELDFNRDIRPLLSEYCFQCHGPDASSREAELRLDQEEDAKADRGGYFVINSQIPSESELLQRLESSDESERMPPPGAKKNLSAEGREKLRQWVLSGAPWSQPWAYVAPQKVKPPAIENISWPKNEIDRFVLGRLEQVGLQPNEPAEPVTLVRRLSFDLTGLPPTPEMVANFVAHPTEDAYKHLVDELLASPHFGERMAVMWLDLVRFADTVGYHGDQTQNIWPYRDYVIHAFNENMPFDQFTVEQLAGDLLPDCTEDQHVATGYNRLLQTSHEGGVQLKEYRAIYLADRVRNVSQVWMGATVGCAQCHDHKYDPYTTRDFYSLGAFFADVDDEKHITTDRDRADRLPTIRRPEIKVLGIYTQQRIAELQDQIVALNDQGKTDDAMQLQAQCEKLSSTRSLTMVTESAEPRTVRILVRGDWQDDSGETVQPAIPGFLGMLDTGGRQATRLDLAHWLTSAEGGAGGLTARVMANRYWALLFGEGLARVLDDFGGQGEAPSHPELLDYLARTYVESGWDTKHLMKEVVLSNTYRQSSQVDTTTRMADPLNLLLARQSRFRLPAEMVRDTLLSISGLLVDEIGGPSVRPAQPPGYYGNLNFPARIYERQTSPQQWRRGVYMHWQRQYLHPMLLAFDAPTHEECTARRPRSNTSLASLVLLNDPNSVEAARSFAQRILKENLAEPDAEVCQVAYRLALSREADAEELQILLNLLEDARKSFHSDQQAAELLAVGDSPRLERIAPQELAAWTTVARAILNLSETTTRN